MDMGTTAALRSDDFIQSMTFDAIGRIVVTGYLQRVNTSTNTVVATNPVTARFSLERNNRLHIRHGRRGRVDSRRQYYRTQRGSRFVGSNPRWGRQSAAAIR